MSNLIIKYMYNVTFRICFENLNAVPCPLQCQPLHFFPILSCVYPISFSVYPTVKTVNQILRLLCIQFCVNHVFRLPFIRFFVYHVNQNTSACLCTNKKNPIDLLNLIIIIRLLNIADFFML